MVKTTHFFDFQGRYTSHMSKVRETSSARQGMKTCNMHIPIITRCREELHSFKLKVLLSRYVYM